MVTEVVNVSVKSRTVALILCLFLGIFGIHHFYAGRIGKGILFLLTAGVFGVGWIVDIFLIACGTYKDATGVFIRKW